MKKLAGFLPLLLFIMMSCAKEYSIEGLGTPGPGDTIQLPVPVEEFPVCPACATSTGQLSEWSFRSGNSLLCGTADTAIITPERNAFTFFGPSSCSEDTGMVITVYLDNIKLDKDISNLSNNKGAFYYYDQVTPSYIFMSLPNVFMYVTITSYVHQTRIVTGTFSGNVVRADGTGASIASGKFKVKII